MRARQEPGTIISAQRRRRSVGRERWLGVAVLLGAVVVVAMVGALVRSGPGAREMPWTFASELKAASSGQSSQTVNQSASSTTQASSSETSPFGGISSGDTESTSPSDTTQSTPSSSETYTPEELAVLFAPLPSSAKAVSVPVLMYHYVDETPPPAGPYADSLTVRTPDFVRQLEYLRSNGFSTVSLADVYLAMAGALALPSKAVVLTFDDGGLDNYEVAFSLLQRYGFTATFFVITSRVGKEGQMTWEQLREMAQAGMAVQSHTVSHPDLTKISSSKLARELADSRAVIEQEVGAPVYALAYPAGAYNSQVILAAKEAGYSLAVSTDKGGKPAPQTIFEIKRARIQAGLSLATFARLVGGQ
ncbi:MAG: polysaccharide deacetylase family protein [Thermoleophilia bacterium]|nr:polysaccharide deacetylase family protein [Thermoleophilia bacterium]